MLHCVIIVSWIEAQVQFISLHMAIFCEVAIKYMKDQEASKFMFFPHFVQPIFLYSVTVKISLSQVIY